MQVKSGTESGKQNRLRGRGMPQIKSSSRGDHFVQFKVAIPTELTERQRGLIMEWAADDAPGATGSVAGLNEYLEAKETATSSAATAAATDSDDGNATAATDNDDETADAHEGGLFESIFGGSKKKEKKEKKAKKGKKDKSRPQSKDAKEQSGSS